MLVLIGALTPLSEAVQHTGGTDLIAGGLAHLLTGTPPLLGARRADGDGDGLLALPPQRADGAGAGADRGVAWRSGCTSTPTRS